DLRRYPHALDLAHPRLEGADAAAADRLTEEPDDEHAPGRRSKFLRGRRMVRVQLEPARKPRSELGVVPLQTPLRIRTARVRRRELNARGAQQAIDLGHRGDQP